MPPIRQRGAPTITSQDLPTFLEVRMPRPGWLVAIVLAAAPLAAQQPTSAHGPAKPTLTSADYAKWETLGAGALSPDGKWVAYDFRRANGTTELHYRAVD